MSHQRVYYGLYLKVLWIDREFFPGKFAGFKKKFLICLSNQYCIMCGVLSENIETAIFAGGCFWGVEYYMGRLPGVISTEAGYIGGHKACPSYEEVKSHVTGHAEAVRITFDRTVVGYETLARRFFEIHDPVQTGGQETDRGPQYRSEIFYMNEEQRRIAGSLIGVLRGRGLDVATRLTPASVFWPAEECHQHYYEKNGGEPECHRYVKRF